MQVISPGKVFKLFLATILLSVLGSTSALAANIKCPTNIKLTPGQIDRNEYALNVENGCSEVVIDVTEFDGKIQNLVFDSHDLTQNYTFDVSYAAAGDTTYKQLYLDKDISTANNNECNAFRDVEQPKYGLNSCFKETVVGVDQKASKIKIIIGMIAGKEAKANEFAYLRNLRINASSSSQQTGAGGANYRKIRYDFVCSNYRFHDLDAVFTGKVTSVTDLPEGDENYTELDVRYRFEVEKVLKGTVLESEKLVLVGKLAENKMEDDKYYIVYAQQLREDKFKPLCVKQLYSPDDVPEYLEQPFEDIQNVEPFRPYIVGLYYNGIVQGYGDSGMYQPDQCVKRSHLAKFLVNTFGFPINTANVNFPDVVDYQSELDQAILTLNNLGIVNGYSDGHYYPDQCVTREQAAAFIVRALQHAYPDLQINTNHNFPDIGGSSFANYIAFLYNIQVNGVRVVNGNSMGYYDPQRPLTRGEMAKIMYLIWIFKNQYRDVKGTCLRNGGSWLETAKECEGLTSQMCALTGGIHSCQSRDRVRLFEEEEIDISVQSSCAQSEVSVCAYQNAVPPYTPIPVPIPSLPAPETRCLEAGGTWLGASLQCNYIDQVTCNKLNGTFNSCGSACGRNYPGICTDQCVYTCYFDEVIPKDCISWYDGCNNCGVQNGKLTMCTMRECRNYGVPRCTQYKTPTPTVTSSPVPTNCSLWYDGCNTCFVENGVIGGCTRRACIQNDVPRCIQYN